MPQLPVINKSKNINYFILNFDADNITKHGEKPNHTWYDKIHMQAAWKIQKLWFFFYTLNCFGIQRDHTLSLILAEEVVDGWHNLWGSSTKELPQAMLSIFLSLFSVIQHWHASASFVNPIANFQTKWTK